MVSDTSKDDSVLGGDRRMSKTFKIPRSWASFPVITSSRAVCSVVSIVFFSRSSVLLSDVRNRDLALHPFDQWFSRSSKLDSFDSFFLWWFLRWIRSRWFYHYIYIPHFPPHRLKLSTHGRRPIKHNKQQISSHFRSSSFITPTPTSFRFIRYNKHTVV